MQAFSETRQQTVELADALYAAKRSPEPTVEHNGLRALSVRAWLAYLSSHAKRETIRLKR